MGASTNEGILKKSKIFFEDFTDNKSKTTSTLLILLYYYSVKYLLYFIE